MTSTTASGRKAPPRVEDFPVVEAEKVRFGDIDMLGHVNNVVFSRYFETGRTNLFEQLGYSFDREAVREANFVMAETWIRFVAELHYPATIDIATGIGRIGRSSVVLPQAIFHESRLIAQAETVCVHMDMANGRSAPVPDDLRAKLVACQVVNASAGVPRG